MNDLKLESVTYNETSGKPVIMHTYWHNGEESIDKESEKNHEKMSKDIKKTQKSLDTLLKKMDKCLENQTVIFSEIENKIIKYMSDTSEHYEPTQLEIQARKHAREQFSLQEEHIKKKRTVNYSKCTICLDRIFTKFKNWLPCAHFFHDQCISEWLKDNITCPECRIPVFIQDDEQLLLYNNFLIKKRNDTELIRQNIFTNDYNLALMFIRDPNLFNVNVIEDDETYEKFQTLIETDAPEFTDETYAYLFDVDEAPVEYDSDYEREAQFRHGLIRYIPEHLLD
jgi:RNA polymerase-binding transcription factor DksA